MPRSRQKIILSTAGTLFLAVVILVLRRAAVEFPEFKKVIDQIVVATSSEPATPPSSSVPQVVSSTHGVWFTVARVVDGDTIELADGTKVRYVGVNTPETHHPTKGVECFGKEAEAYNAALVVGKRVRLEKDVSETDRYGRLLRFVYLEDATFVNKKLIEDGYATVMTYAPDVAKSKEFVVAEAAAREAGLGLWKQCR